MAGNSVMTNVSPHYTGNFLRARDVLLLPDWCSLGQELGSPI